MGRILLAILIFLSPCVVHAADDFAAKLKELTKKAKEIEGVYLSEERKLKSIDQEVSRIQGRIPKVKESVQKKQEQIKSLDRQINTYEAELEQSKDKMLKEWVALYKSASLDTVSVYYGNEKYAGYLDAVLRHHADVLRQYQMLRQRLKSTRERTNNLAELLKKDLSELQGTATALDSERAKKTRLITSLKGRSQAYQDEIEDLIKEIQRREKERKERLKRELARKERERKEREKREKGRYEKKEKDKEKETIAASGGFFESKGKLPWPARGRIVRSFGSFKTQGVLQKSQGLDIELKEGSPVKCIYPGTIVYANWMGKYGNTVILDHGNGFYTIYGYLQEAVKSAGQKVSGSEVIGRAGQTGSILNPMLHFEIRFHQKAMDPSLWLMQN